jgi:hypothetical protein
MSLPWRRTSGPAGLAEIVVVLLAAVSDVVVAAGSAAAVLAGPGTVDGGVPPDRAVQAVTTVARTVIRLRMPVVVQRLLGGGSLPGGGCSAMASCVRVPASALVVFCAMLAYFEVDACSS